MAVSGPGFYMNYAVMNDMFMHINCIHIDAPALLYMAVMQLHFAAPAGHEPQGGNVPEPGLLPLTWLA